MSDKPCPSEAELLAFADADFDSRAVGARENASGAMRRLCQADRGVFEVDRRRGRTARSTEVRCGRARRVGDQALGLAGEVHPRFATNSVERRFHRGASCSRGVGRVHARTNGTAGQTEGPAVPAEHFEARGGAADAGPSRDIGVQLYALDPSLHALASGAPVRAGTPLTAGLRNLGDGAAYLLLFGVDSKHAVHWIAPEFTKPGTHPEAISIAPKVAERLLPRSVTFDDLAPGRLRLVTVITNEPTHVSAVEGLAAAELEVEGLARRFPGAEIRELTLEVLP